MKKVIIADERVDFLADISNRLIIDEERDIDVVDVLTTANNIESIVKDKYADELCISENILVTRDNWNIQGVKVTVYAQSIEGVQLAAKKQIFCYGKILNAGNLLDLVEKDSASLPKPSVETKKEDVKEEKNELNDLFSEETVLAKEETCNEEEKSNSSLNTDIDDINNYLFGDIGNVKIPQKEKSVVNEVEKKTEAPKTNDDINKQPDIRKQIYKELDTKREADYENADKIIRKKRKRAKIITIYSAKGGVGKTTINCELGAFLSLVSNGRKKNRVCIIDYNFDFGDVMTTLTFDNKGVNMSYWANDITEKLESGLKKEDIIYTKSEIETYLQQWKDTDLYALLAPIQHQDSMVIHSPELEIMISNIIKFGEIASYPEVLLHYISNDNELRLAGQADLVLINEDEVQILDFKTNKEIKKSSHFNTVTKKHKMMKYPLNNLMDSNYWHYAMQLSTYAWMIQQIDNRFNIKTLNLIHYDHNNKRTIYPVPYLKKEVEAMLKEYKRSLKTQELYNKIKPFSY